MKNLRVLSLLLILALFAGILSACGTDRQKWQDTLHLKTYDEVEAVLGKPDTSVEENPLGGTQYRDVTFAGVNGIYYIASMTRQEIEEGIINAREFRYAVDLSNKTLQDVYDDGKKTFDTICNYLNDTYGTSQEYQWSYTLEDGSTIMITVGALWPYGAIEDGTWEVDASSWKSTPAIDLINEDSEESYKLFGNRLTLAMVRFSVKSPK